MMDYHIRPLIAQDLRVVHAIEEAVHIAPWDQYTLETIFRLEGVSLVLEDPDERIIGYLFCSTVIDEAHLLNIAIAEKYQGRGLGRKLLQSLIDHLEEEDFYSLLLEVRESNDAAYHLYGSLGFNTVGRRRGYYPTKEREREDAIVMALSLAL